MTDTKLFSGSVSTPFGNFIYIAKTTKHDAISDLSTLINSELRLPFGTFRVKDIVEASSIDDASPIKTAVVNGELWGWSKRIGR